MKIHHSVFDFHGAFRPVMVPLGSAGPAGRARHCRYSRGEESSPIGGARAEGGAITDSGSERGTGLGVGEVEDLVDGVLRLCHEGGGEPSQGSLDKPPVINGADLVHEQIGVLA